MNAKEVTHNYRLNHWTEIIRECRNSGQTISDWCADHNIKTTSYYYWLKRVRRAAGEALSATRCEAKEIVPINCFEPVADTGISRSELPSDIIMHFGSVTLEIHNNASSTLIENTLRALQNVR